MGSIFLQRFGIKHPGLSSFIFASAKRPSRLTRFTLSKHDLGSVFVSLKSYFRVPYFVFSISVKNEKWNIETQFLIGKKIQFTIYFEAKIKR